MAIDVTRTGEEPASGGDRPDTPPEYADTAAAVLNLLGGTAEEIAANLHTLQVTGHRGDAQFCPIATYLRDRDIPVDEVRPALENGATYGTVTFEEQWLDHHCHRPVMLDLPQVVSEFGRRFDAGEFPELAVTAPGGQS